MIFDAYIGKVAEYVAGLAAKGRPVKTFAVPTAPSALQEGLKVNVGQGANPRIILRSDTFLELGNPEAGSAACLLFTTDKALVKSGRITVIGPDIPESVGRSLPFGQVLIIGGIGLSVKDLDALTHTGIIGDGIEGYMVRSATQSVWSRVSKAVVAKGFDFETLGRALMARYRLENDPVEAMEAIFVTSSAEDIRQLGDIAAQVRKVSREIVKENWKVRGIDIDCGLDCSTCGDKPVCDDIREVLNVRKAAADGPTGHGGDGSAA